MTYVQCLLTVLNISKRAHKYFYAKHYVSVWFNVLCNVTILKNSTKQAFHNWQSFLQQSHGEYRTLLFLHSYNSVLNMQEPRAGT